MRELTALLQRVEAGETTVTDAEQLRQYFNQLSLRATWQRERLLGLRGAIWDVCEQLQGEGLSVRAQHAVAHAAQLAEYRGEL
jgi:hypothetical protein